MNSVSFEGFNAKYLTFRKAGAATLKRGDFVSIDKNYTVKEFTAGQSIIGKCVDVRDNLITVQVAGYMTAPLATGQKISYGYNVITFNSSGEIMQSASTGRHVLVIEMIDSKTIGFIL